MRLQGPSGKFRHFCTTEDRDLHSRCVPIEPAGLRNVTRSRRLSFHSCNSPTQTPVPRRQRTSTTRDPPTSGPWSPAQRPLPPRTWEAGFKPMFSQGPGFSAPSPRRPKSNSEIPTLFYLGVQGFGFQPPPFPAGPPASLPLRPRRPGAQPPLSSGPRVPSSPFLLKGPKFHLAFG